MELTWNIQEIGLFSGIFKNGATIEKLKVLVIVCNVNAFSKINITGIVSALWT